MATRQWTQQSGDWFSTASWRDATTGQLAAAPTSGDTAEIFTGTVSITAADAATAGHGTLDGITVMFTPISGDATPTLDVTNEQFGSGMYVFTDAAPGLGGALVARGTVGFAGTLQGDFSGATLTLDIEAQNGAAVFTNTGTLKASDGGTLSVIGTADAVLANSGLLRANNGSTLAIATAVTSTSLGTVEALVQGLLDVAGPFTNQGTLFASQLVSGLYEAGTIDITGSLTNAGDISDAYFGVIAATGGVANSGTIDDAGGAVTLGGGVTNTDAIIVSAGSLGFTGAVGNAGTITDGGGTLGFDGPVTNSGLLIDEAGTLTIAGRLAGSGTIQLADHVTLDGAVAAGQVIDFGSATDATLDLGDPSQFDGTIAGVNGHDIIQLGTAATGASYDATTQVLSVLDGTSLVAAFTIEGGATSLNVGPGALGDAVLTAETIGSPSAMENYIVQNDFATFDGGTPQTHAWPTPDATIYYTFEPGSTLTTADESGFLRGMSLYQDLADITFVQAELQPPCRSVHHHQWRRLGGNHLQRHRHGHRRRHPGRRHRGDHQHRHADTGLDRPERSRHQRHQRPGRLRLPHRAARARPCHRLRPFRAVRRRPGDVELPRRPDVLHRHAPVQRHVVHRTRRSPAPTGRPAPPRSCRRRRCCTTSARRR